MRWLAPALRYGIPIATLAAFVVAVLLARLRPGEVAPPPIAPPPAAALAPVDFGPRDERVDGRVVAPDGAPVEGALVWLRAGDRAAWTYSGADGRFALESLPRGPWEARIVALGFQPERRTLADTGRPQTIELPRPLGPAPSLAPIARSVLAGRVVAPASADLAGSEVVLVPTAPPETLGAPVPRVAEVARDGGFRFDELIHGSYEVELRPKWARGGTWPDLLRGLEQRPRVVAHGPDAAELVLEPASGAIVGRLADESGAPLEGALVLVQTASDTSRVWPPISTGGGGGFEAIDLPAGRYLVTYRAGSASAREEVVVAPSQRLELPPRTMRQASGAPPSERRE